MRRKEDEPLIYDSFEELLDILAEEQRKAVGQRRHRQIVLAMYGLVFFVLMLMLVLTHIHLASIGSFIGPIISATAGVFAVSAKQRKGVQALAAFEDVRAVPYLIAGLGYKDQNSQVTAANALRGLLPRLQASDAALLTPEHHALLNRVLKNDLELTKPNVARLRVAILRVCKETTSRLQRSAFTLNREVKDLQTLNALQQIGNEGSLPLVEEMAQGKGKAAGKSEIQWAAQECLPYLRLRAENQRQTQTLLRALDGNMTPADMLLRPASDLPVSTLRANELLRVPASEADTQTVAQPVFAVHEAQQTEQELRLH